MTSELFTYPNETASDQHEWELPNGIQVFHVGMGKDGGFVWHSITGEVFVDTQNLVRDRTPTPATSQGAPETIWVKPHGHYNSGKWLHAGNWYDGPSPAEGYVDPYTRKDLPDVRIAELEAKVGELSWLRESDFRAELATARNEALEEAAKVVEPRGPEPDVDYSNHGDTAELASWHADNGSAKGIRSLKTPDTQEVELKTVKPDVVYDLAAMAFGPDLSCAFAGNIDGVVFLWHKTPEGDDYWADQYPTPTAEGRDKIAAMREQFEREEK